MATPNPGTGSTSGSASGTGSTSTATGVTAEPCGCDSTGANVVSCDGDVVEACDAGTACDAEALTCSDACELAAGAQHSTGCEFYSVYTDNGLAESEVCFATFVVNTSHASAQLEVAYDGFDLPLELFAAHPVGAGSALTWERYNPSAGLAPGEAVGLFLVGASADAPGCPIPPALTAGGALSNRTGIGRTFRITSDMPVAAFQFNPYGTSASNPATGASLLIPASSYGTNYLLATAHDYVSTTLPSLNIVARDDMTTLALLPRNTVQGGGGIPPAVAQQQMTVPLQSGWHAQLSQAATLTGSILQSTAPVGVFATHQCMRVPTNYGDCDHAEEMLPPVSAMGHEYVGVMHKPRVGEPMMWRLIGAVDGTVLSWSTEVGGPTTLARGQIVDIQTPLPFVVQSQGPTHPFLLLGYMGGSQWPVVPGLSGYGDPEMVVAVPPQQFMTRYGFFTDPAVPENSIVVVRTQQDGEFHDVELDCFGTLQGWQPLGTYEWTRVDLTTGMFADIGECSAGAHEISSAAPFGVYVWGWGTPATSTAGASYGYAAGARMSTLNGVIIPAQ